MDASGDAREQRFLRFAGGETRRRTRPTGGSRPRLLAALVAALLVASAVGIVHWLRVTPRLAVREVVVRGALRTPIGVLDGLRQALEGRSLLRLDLGMVAASLRSATPWVEAASVRRLPPGRVEIDIVERRPLARLEDGSALVAAAGILLPAEPGRPGDQALPTIRLSAGERAPAVVRRSAELLALLSQGVDPLLARVETVDASDAEDLVLLLRDRSYAVHVGHGHFADRLNRFRNAEAVIASRYASLDRVDLRFAGRIVVSPVATPPSAQGSGS